MIRLKSNLIWTALVLLIAIYNMSMLGSIVYPTSGDIMKKLFIACACTAFFVTESRIRRNDLVFVGTVAITYLFLMWCNGSSMVNAIALVARFVSSYLFCLFCRDNKIDCLNMLANICYLIVFFYLILFILIELIPNPIPSQTIATRMTHDARDSRLNSVVRYWDYLHLYFRRQMIEIGHIKLPRCSHLLGSSYVSNCCIVLYLVFSL